MDSSHIGASGKSKNLLKKSKRNEKRGKEHLGQFQSPDQQSVRSIGPKGIIQCLTEIHGISVTWLFVFYDDFI